MKLNIKKIKTNSKVNSKPTKREYINIENMKDLSSFVKSSRIKNRQTQDDVAKYSNVSRFAISEFESGKSDIKLSTLLKILKGCSLQLEVKER